MDNADIFHNAVARKGGRLDLVRLDAAVAKALDYAASRARGFLQTAAAAGGTIVKPSTTTVFGANGYFGDPDGHLWEVAFNPGFPIGPDGRITIP